MLTNIYGGETVFHVCIQEWHKTLLDRAEDKNNDLVDPKTNENF